MNLARRVLEPELMDDPDLDGTEHDRALAALARVNRISLDDRRASRELARIAAGSGGPVRVLDVGCGDGTLLVRLASAARRAGTAVVLHGCDVSSHALRRAAARAAAEGVALTLHELDVTRDPLPHGYDLVTCSLFLHHLTDADAVDLLRSMAAAGRFGLVQDLRRTLAGYALAWVGLRLFGASRVARVDGARSVRAAFRLGEVRGLCAEAGLDGASVRPVWPQRFTVRWGGAVAG